jgi:polyisoprenoid-binding protein YceI
VGLATGVTGTVTFDPEKPEATSGALSVAAASIQMAHPVMTKVLHSAELHRDR